MPSVDALDNTDDELLNSDLALDDSTMPSLAIGRREEISFDPSYFEDNSSDDDTVELDPRSSVKAKPQGRPRKRQTSKEPEVGDFVKETLGAAVQAAIQSSVMGALQTLSGNTEKQASRAAVRTARTHGDPEYDNDHVDQGHSEASRDRLGSDDSATLDIEEDFEFLEEYELDTSRESEGH